MVGFSIPYEVTQTMADRLMAINTHNRKLNATKIRHFVRMIEENRFLLHGQGIASVTASQVTGNMRLSAHLITKRPVLPLRHHL